MKPLTILLTGCGAPGTPGTIMALRQNPDNRPVRIIGVDVNANTPGRQLVDAFAPVLPPENVDYRSRLLDVCLRHHVHVVIPQTTREVGHLSYHNGGTPFDTHGICVMASRVARRANDKRVCMSLAQSARIPVPEWQSIYDLRQLRQAAERRYPNPFVVKPHVSNGSRGVRIVNGNSWDMERFLTEKPSGIECDIESLSTILDQGGVFPELLVMDYLPGPEYSVDCFRGTHVWIAVPRIRTAMRGGISTDTTIVDEPEMARHALVIAKRLGLTGVYGVQFKANAEGIPCLLEVNPRVQGTMVASVLAGANVIWMAVREAIGEPVRVTPTVRIGTRCVRHWVVSKYDRENVNGNDS